VEASAVSARRARWLGIAALATAFACNAYDESLAGHERDAGTTTTLTTASGGGAGVMPSTGSQGGAGGFVQDASGGGGGTTTSSDATTTEDVAARPDSPSTTDAASNVDAPHDTPGPVVDSGTDVGQTVDVRSEPPPAVRDAKVDAPAVGDSMIDDMEDPDDAILVTDGRRGAWFVLNDGSDGGVQVPAMGAPFDMTAIPGGRGASAYAAHTSGQGFTTWSPLVGFWLNKAPSAFKQLYDASRYNAITFWARTSASDAAKFSASVRVQFPDRDTDPDGQVCTADGSLGCSDHYGRNVVLTSDWVKYTIRFSQLQQAGFGQPAGGFDAAHMYGVEFQFALGSAFDCWIDDIAFAAQ
jgi:hypothetical protein